MKRPTDTERTILVTVLRLLDLSQEVVASALKVRRETVGKVEDWIREAPLEEVQAIFENDAIKRTVGRELPSLEEIEGQVLVRADQVTADDILRHYRGDYPLRTEQPEQPEERAPEHEEILRLRPELEQLRQQKAVDLLHRLEAVGKRVLDEFSLPPPECLGSWVPPWKGILAVWPPQVADRRLRSLRWKPAADGPGKYWLAVEDVEGGRHYSQLKAHLPEPFVPWTDLDQWKAGVASLLWDCRRFATDIVHACEEATGAKVNPDQEKFDQGLWWGFPAQVYYGHLRAAQQYDDPLDYTPEYTSTGWTLRKAGYRVAGHTCLGAILKWRDVHTKLLECPKWKKRARELVERYRVLEQQAESVQQALRREVERGMFDGGRCDDRCPYSKRGAAGWPGGQ